MLRIEIKNRSDAFHPGSTIHGKIYWEQPTPPRTLTAVLFWYTEGKGDEDTETVIEQDWTPNAAQGTESFQWEVPRGPISKVGSLINICWAIEVVTTKPAETARLEIVISHLGRPVNSNSP
jgi:hypothetical protein